MVSQKKVFTQVTLKNAAAKNFAQAFGDFRLVSSK